MTAPTRLVQVRQHVLKENDVAARALRHRFHDAHVSVVSLVSSPGTGKTTFLEKTLVWLRSRFRVAALVGDLATDNDAQRLARAQVAVRQITTGTLCHLEAAMVSSALEGWNLDQLDFLFIENVGNLVCPSTYDLGEDLRLVLLSVTGEKTSRSSTRRSSTRPMSPSSPSSTWLPLPSSIARWPAGTSNRSVPACK
jgi:hydrogenase nickel incorporation protein HypB